jgi:FAD:protein FMN transferase
MSIPPQAVPIFANPALIKYSQDAMKTTFRIYVDGGDRNRVDSAVSDAFQKLEELEGILSRYVPGSDISRINRMNAGDTLFLSDECDRCLRLAIDASQATGGCFDPCIGTLVDVLKSGSVKSAGLSGIVSLDVDRPLMTCVEAGRVVDLGAIGKGYALERMGEILEGHGVGSALLTSGASTMLGMGAREWPVDLPHSSGSRRIRLRSAALAASGNAVQGDHIVDPADGSPAQQFTNVWVVHPRAPYADAFSTACFVMSPEEIRQFAVTLPPGAQVIGDPDWEL